MERLKRIRGAIFDLDGTLLDSMGIWSEIDQRFLIRRGIEPPGDYTAMIKTMEFSQAAEYTIDRFHLNERPEALMNEWTLMAQDAYAHEIKLKPMAKVYLKSLVQRGVRLGVATSSTEELFIPALKNNGVFDLFSVFTTTKEVSRGKRFPDIYLKTAQKLDLPPSDCVVFEDALHGIQGAGSGGFLTVCVYDASSDLEKEAAQCAADIYIHSFAELL